MPFTTKINFQDNRQHRLPEREYHNLDGITEFGVPFSALTSGPDSTTSATTSTIINIVSSFSGNTGTTVFTFGHPSMNIAQNVFSAITDSTSAITQNSGYVWVGDVSQVVDGNTSYLNYTGITFDIIVTAITETSPGIFTGSVVSDDVFYLSAGTLDFTGRTIWSEVKGIHKTNRLIVTNGAQTGYVLTALNNDGDIYYAPVSGITGGTTLWSAGTGSNGVSAKSHSSVASGINSVTWGFDNEASGRYATAFGENTLASGETSTAHGTRTQAYGDSSFTGGKSESPYLTTAYGIAAFNHSSGTFMDSEANANYSAILGGTNFLIDSGSTHSILLGGSYNIISGSTTYSGIICGFDHVLSGGTNSVIVGGDNNAIASSTSIIIGGSSNLITDGAIGDASGSFIGGCDNGYISNASAALVGGSSNRIIGSASSVIIGGSDNLISNSSSTNAIIGSSGSTINSGLTNTIILGGVGFTGGVSNMVYVPDLIIDGLTSTDPIATDADGKIVAGTSDARLKKNINDLSNALDLIKNIRGVSFEYTEESNMGPGLRYGFIAQEVQKIIPDLVKFRSKGDGMLNLNYTEIIPWLVEAIKDLTSGDIDIRNTILETQTIVAEDNSIELNFGGTHETSIGGGISVKSGVNDNTDSFIKIDENGRWVVGPSLTTSQLTLPEFTPKSSNENIGLIGDVVWDDDYVYIKTNTGWKRTGLEKF